MKSVLITDETHQRLSLLKSQHSLRTLDKAILFLLERE